MDLSRLESHSRTLTNQVSLARYSPLLEEELHIYPEGFQEGSRSPLASFIADLQAKTEVKGIERKVREGQKGQPLVSEFLHQAKEKYEAAMHLPADQQPTIHFVMGNESADLDSIMASIAYAYSLNQENGSQKNDLYIPLMNIRREEITLRKDTLYLFKLLNISMDDLLFLDDQVPFDLLVGQNKLRINLVDHNLLRPSLEHLSPVVERVIDHHVNENKTYPLLKQEDSVISIVGSATTLVAEKVLANQRMTLTPELAALLLGPILIDTSNLKSEEKTTERDRKVVELLWPIASSIISNDYYDKLVESKRDVSGLTPDMLLNKDFKEYLDGELRYGISSLPDSVCWGNEDEQMLRPVLEKFATERGLDFLIVLMTNPNPHEHHRKIIVYSSSDQLSKAFNSYVTSDKALKDVLISKGISAEGRMGYYTTEQLIARKQLQPLFHFSQSIEIMNAFK